MLTKSAALVLFLVMLLPLGVFAQEADGWRFVPGDTPLLLDDYSVMTRGYAPPHWKVRGAAVRLADGRLTFGAGSSTRMTPNVTAWPDNFTIEMNLQGERSADDAMRNLTWVFERGDSWIWQATLALYAGGSCQVTVEIADPGENSRAACNWLPDGTNNVALWVQDDRLRIYVNGQRLIDMNQLNLPFETASLMVSADALPVSFGAFRIAQSGTGVSTMALAGGQTSPAIRTASPVAENLSQSQSIVQDQLKKSAVQDADQVTNVPSIAQASNQIPGQATLTVRPRPIASLPVIEAFLADPPFVTGTAVTLKWAISGDFDTAEIQPGAYRITAADGSASIPLSQTTTFTLIVANVSGSVQQQVTANKVIMETAPNAGSETGFVIKGTPAGPLADLVITKTELWVGNPGQIGQINGAPIYTHSRVLISLGVTNQGDAEVDLKDYHCHLKLTQKPDNVNSCVTLGQMLIKPGETTSGGIFFLEPNQLAPGEYPMTFTVDPENKIAEKNEANNDAPFFVSILPSNLGSGLPDLVITGVSPTMIPSNPCLNGEVEVSIKNQGTGFAYINTGMIINHASNFEAYSTGIAVYILAGETYKARIKTELPLPVSPGTYPATFKLDPYNIVKEINELNNEYPYTFPISNFSSAGLPDLVVTSVVFNPASPATSDRVDIQVNMKNQGQGNAYFCKGTTEWMSKTVGGTGPGGGGVNTSDAPRIVPPGETFSGGVYLNWPGQYPAGNYEIESIVDPGNKVAESNDNNNSMKVTLTFK